MNPLNPPLNFLPGLNENVVSDTFEDSIAFSRVFIHPLYQRFQDQRFDISIVELSQPANVSKQFLQFDNDSVCKQSNCFLVNIVGYREDRDFGSLWLTTCGDLKMRCSQLAASHTCNTVGGMSGAPVIVKSENDSYILLGINSQGIQDQDLGRIVLLNDQVKAFLQEILS
eukprot:TRINITY_DN50275_c0_g1_i1.p2 TRINITY_DN50275_c0_g1~~TRINITY_DN50275_c0_g1_i1.p2  ORF type:complete len:170 (-),score=14.54 TRINITY_DN50275_c0_g1_i1:105-614(-)